MHITLIILSFYRINNYKSISKIIILYWKFIAFNKIFFINNKWKINKEKYLMINILMQKQLKKYLQIIRKLLLFSPYL